jgi:hypothetical protein
VLLVVSGMEYLLNYSLIYLYEYYKILAIMKKTLLKCEVDGNVSQR